MAPQLLPCLASAIAAGSLVFFVMAGTRPDATADRLARDRPSTRASGRPPEAAVIPYERFQPQDLPDRSRPPSLATAQQASGLPAAAPAMPMATKAVPSPPDPEPVETGVAVDPPAAVPVEAAAVVAQDLGRLTELGLSGLESPAFQKVLEWTGAAGPEQIFAFTQALQREPQALARFLGTLALSASRQPEAARHMTLALATDPDLLVRRAASNALATQDAPEAHAALTAAMHTDVDLGVRANAAFALAVRGDAAGRDALLALYADPGTQADVRASIFMMVAQLEDPQCAPFFRQVLAVDRDPTRRLIALRMIEAFKDREALPLLVHLAGDPDEPEALRALARGSLQAVQQP